eukprot:TRINITY_DN40164_c0_g1_i1.p1 TRINITY_DN40164_c0_g1~~TRINITY_DN40164_c0_g1_i1.p1  ORF type:complete len:463 (+),score=75.11 TRINITY_DN40164_c0_g1_i1:149-1390(+)
MSIVLPSGFWWPPLSAAVPKPIIGWSQPAAALEDITTEELEWIGYNKQNGKANRPEVALILGLDPAVAPRNIFHFAQLVLPAFSARVRRAWQSGAGSGSGLLRPPPKFGFVVIADPMNSTRFLWQKGLLDLITGGDGQIEILSGQQYKQEVPWARCFRHVVLPGNGLKDSAVPSTGRADHASLLVEASRQIPGLTVMRRDVVVPLRRKQTVNEAVSDGGRAAPGTSRHILNEPEFLSSIRLMIKAMTGAEPCSETFTGAVPCVREHLGDGSFADQVRLFSTCGLIVGMVGAGFTNMIFMPPESVALVGSTPATKDYYAGFAFLCGHLGLKFFIECSQDVREPSSGADFALSSARVCRADTPCLTAVNDKCDAKVDMPTFLPLLASALSHAFPFRLQQLEYQAVREVTMTLTQI